MMNLSRIPCETAIGRFLRWPLRLIPEHTVMWVLQRPLVGKSWITGSLTHSCWLGSYEFEKQNAFAQAIGPQDVVYDIGANVGFYTLLASTRCRFVCAFEPLPRNLEYLRRHLKLNRVTNCEVIEAAVTDFDGMTGFAPSAEATEGRVSAEAAMRVRTLSLDALVERGGLRPPTVMKIDIEGGELSCLKGGEHVLRAHRPRIFLATHGNNECARTLSRRTPFARKVLRFLSKGFFKHVRQLLCASFPRMRGDFFRGPASQTGSQFRVGIEAANHRS